MAKAEATIWIADIVPVKDFITATAGLLRALAGCSNLPAPVISAADEVRRAAVALGANDPGPPPA